MTRWKAYSPPLNAPKQRSSPGAKKTTMFRRNFTAANRATQKVSLCLLMLQKIELIRERTSSKVAKFDNFGILRSLLVNEKTSQSPVSLLRKIGFVHLASATGIHLYALARGWDSLLRIGFFSLRLPTSVGIWCSRILSFILCFCVWVLSGARVGMLRPWIVLSLREISTLLGFRWRRASPLFLALMLDFGVACFWSLTGREAFGPSGRIIYALAVGGGLIWCRSFKSIHAGLAIGSWLLVALWEAWHSGSVALFTPILSLISLPLLCFFVFPLVIASIAVGELGFEKLSELAMRETSWGLSFLIDWLARFAFSYGNFWVVSQSALLSAFFLASLICALQFYHPWKRKKIFLVVGSLLTLRLVFEISSPLEASHNPYSASKIGSHGTQVEQLDVGQGDAALIRSGQSGSSNYGPVGLIDAGSQHALSDEGWIQLFATRQITRLNWAAISHLDEDHSGGFLRLARLIGFDCIATPRAQLESLRGGKYRKVFLQHALQIQGWTSGCIPYPSFSPPSILSKIKNRPNENMGAIWIPLRAGGFYLAAGDANQCDEILIGHWAAQLIGTHSTEKRILKISHHGSKSSSAPEFLKLVNPSEVWISAGRGNRYGHPAPAVLERLQNLEVPIKRTDQEGLLSAY
ncbi:MAG: hypothetical protein ABI041_09795 [Bdellovibrionia bacterium]